MCVFDGCRKQKKRPQPHFVIDNTLFLRKEAEKQAFKQPYKLFQALNVARNRFYFLHVQT
jgi:hypothetical protein